MITYLVDGQPGLTLIDRAASVAGQRPNPSALRIIVLPTTMQDAFAREASLTTDSLDDATWEDAEWR